MGLNNDTTMIIYIYTMDDDSNTWRPLHYVQITKNNANHSRERERESHVLKNLTHWPQTNH